MARLLQYGCLNYSPALSLEAWWLPGSHPNTATICVGHVWYSRWNVRVRMYSPVARRTLEKFKVRSLLPFYAGGHDGPNQVGS
jgi:hypothetical protein